MSPQAAQEAFVAAALILGIMWYVGRANLDRREHSPTITVNVQPSIGNDHGSGFAVLASLERRVARLENEEEPPCPA